MAAAICVAYDHVLVVALVAAVAYGGSDNIVGGNIVLSVVCVASKENNGVAAS